jgi:hypothetical protein
MRHDNQEDADIATGLIGCIVLAVASGALLWYALG